jgi:PAS domain S-box-containing protein
MDKIKVLYIDDEQENLMAFHSSFRRMFDVYIAKSAAKGIEILKSEHIEIIIADQRMPDMTGVDFFESILDDYPNPIRILLTGYSDMNAVKDAINKGHVYLYLNKPWNEYELKVSIENAYLVYQLKEQNHKLKNKYQKIFSESLDAIMIFDEHLRLIDYNQATLKLFNTIKPQLNSTLLTDLVPNIIEGDYILNTLKNNEKGIVNYESKLRFNGIEKACLISASKISDNHDKPSIFQAIIRDVTKNVEQEQLIIKTYLSSVETERNRISKDLHDGVGQSIVGIKFQLDQLKLNATEKQLKILNVTSDLLAQTLQQLRNICFNILPPSLSEYGLLKAIEQLSKNLSTKDLSINTNLKADLPFLKKNTIISIYRIIQEFIQNSIKHANCSKIEVDFEVKETEVILILKDNGSGFDINKTIRINGISNMKTRAKSINGTFYLSSKLNEGTKLVINIPLDELTQNKLPTNNKKTITTSSALIFLKDEITIIKFLDVTERTIEKKHIIENEKAIKILSKDKKHPIIIYLSDIYINNEAIVYFINNSLKNNTCAIIFDGFLQEKIAYLFSKENLNRVQSFNTESEAFQWINKQKNINLNLSHYEKNKNIDC